MDHWSQLRSLTSARIAVGRSGGSLLTRERLDFLLAHARARDAVLAPFDAAALAGQVGAVLSHPVIVVNSAARDRAEYLQRPDLGRQLSSDSRALLTEKAMQFAACDLVIIVSDGLSTLAANTQTEPLLSALIPLILRSGWTLAPIVVAQHARVALQDEVGEILRARVGLMLLGERPGLGSADSMGAYFTFKPAVGKTDADRNCISNIRDGGLTPPEAAKKLHALLVQSFHLGLSGVQLKDESGGGGEQLNGTGAISLAEGGADQPRPWPEKELM